MTKLYIYIPAFVCPTLNQNWTSVDMRPWTGSWIKHCVPQNQTLRLLAYTDKVVLHMQRISARLEKQHTLSVKVEGCMLFLYNPWETDVLNNALAYRKLHYSGLKTTLTHPNSVVLRENSHCFFTPSDMKNIHKKWLHGFMKFKVFEESKINK